MHDSEVKKTMIIRQVRPGIDGLCSAYFVRLCVMCEAEFGTAKTDDWRFCPICGREITRDLQGDE